MSRSLLNFSCRSARLLSRPIVQPSLSTFRMASTTLDSSTISKVTEKEAEITGSNQPTQGGPTAAAQKHAGEPINSETLSDITAGEKKVTGGERVKGGPTAAVQSELSKAQDNSSTQTSNSNNNSNSGPATGKLDSQTISKITAAETEITGDVHPVKGGPTAQAQKHVGEEINSENLHDITEGEKKITGGERVQGGPTATAQSELGKARTN